MPSDTKKPELGPLGTDWFHYYTLDQDGNPVPFTGNPGSREEMEHVYAYFGEEGGKKKRVNETSVGPFWVSTVFLVINHSYREGPPLVFETMVFLGKVDPNNSDQEVPENPFDEYQERYSTRVKALEGHERAVQMCRNHLATENP